MAIVIVATPGAANANSFGTLEEADAYFATRLYSTAWTSADIEVKKAALIMATSALTANICWVGSPTDAVQVLPFPRTGMSDRNGNEIADTVIPQDLKIAEFELALAMLKSDRTAESDIEAVGLTKLKAGPVELSFSGAGGSEVITSYAKSFLPSQWLCPVADTRRSVVFEVL